MAHPRRVVPDETYLITRRCYQRTFRLRPSEETNGIFRYCLAFAMHKTGVRLHAACVMSNHHHLVVTDPRGALPDFLRELHRLTAKALNASQGQWENLWAAEPCNVVRLVTDADVEDKIAYVVANPVAAGVVSDPSEWPGIVMWGDSVARVERPRSYFREDGTCPPELSLSVEQPPVRDGAASTLEEWRTRVSRAIRAKVVAARESVRSAGEAFLGTAAVLASSFAKRALSYERRFGIIPTFAAKLRSVRERLRRAERQFRASYREAFRRWRTRAPDVVFPWGTWGVVVVHGAQAERAPGT